MKYKKFLLILSIGSIFGVGCRSIPPTKTVRFDSSPEGARIFMTSGINESSSKGAENYLGSTPFEHTFRVQGDGTFQIAQSGVPFYSKFVQAVAVFTAQPPDGATNLFVKREVFHSAAQFQAGNPAPDGMFFDLTKP